MEINQSIEQLRLQGLMRCACCKQIKGIEQFGNSSKYIKYYCLPCLSNKNHEYFLKIRKTKLQLQSALRKELGLSKKRGPKKKSPKLKITPKPKIVTHKAKPKIVTNKVKKQSCKRIVNFMINFD
jgi:hypothetical protein